MDLAHFYQCHAKGLFSGWWCEPDAGGALQSRLRTSLECRPGRGPKALYNCGIIVCDKFDTFLHAVWALEGEKTSNLPG